MYVSTSWITLFEALHSLFCRHCWVMVSPAFMHLSIRMFNLFLLFYIRSSRSSVRSPHRRLSSESWQTQTYLGHQCQRLLHSLIQRNCQNQPLGRWSKVLRATWKPIWSSLPWPERTWLLSSYRSDAARGRRHRTPRLGSSCLRSCSRFSKMKI